MRRAASKSTLTRIHVPEMPAGRTHIDLPPAAAHHLARVMRAVVGDNVTVFAAGMEFAATITRMDKRGVAVKLGAGRVVDREAPLGFTLAQGISSGERMDFTLQKAVELGIKAVQPLFSERSVVRLDAERAGKRMAHWQQVLISACEQCGRNEVPELAAPQAVIDWLGTLPPPSGGEGRILLSPRADARLAELPRPSAVILLAGPEGGFADVESSLAQQRGFLAVRLGPRVLRTETAALAALAAMQTLWGDF